MLNPSRVSAVPRPRTRRSSPATVPAPSGELKAMWLCFRDDARRGARRACDATPPTGSPDLYCDDGRWDDAEECLAFDRGRSRRRTSNLRPARRREARLAAHRGELDEALDARPACRRARREQRQPEPASRASGCALAEVQRAAGETARPTPPSRRRSSSTSRRGTSPPPSASRRPRYKAYARYLNCAFATIRTPASVSCTPVRFVLKAANVTGL